MPCLFLFDIDGTLVLTGGAGSRAMTRAFRDVFHVDDAFRAIPMPGRTDPLIVADAATRAGVVLDGLLLSGFRRRYRECLREEMDEPGPRKGVLPGVRPLLDALQARPDAFLALLTGNYTDAARIKLEYFDLWRYFSCGAFGEEAAARDDLVPVAVERARACGVPQAALDRVVVVGDTPLDVACAHSGDAIAVAVASGGHSVQELADGGADVVLEDLTDTQRFLYLLDNGFGR
jgi:phosphoglycolate phosphatase-like HAD superfamily hydrolase